MQINHCDEGPRFLENMSVKTNAEGFFLSQSLIAINFDPLKFLRGPYFLGRRSLGPSKAESW